MKATNSRNFEQQATAEAIRFLENTGHKIIDAGYFDTGEPLFTIVSMDGDDMVFSYVKPQPEGGLPSYWTLDREACEEQASQYRETAAFELRDYAGCATRFDQIFVLPWCGRAVPFRHADVF